MHTTQAFNVQSECSDFNGLRNSEMEEISQMKMLDVQSKSELDVLFAIEQVERMKMVHSTVKHAQQV